MIDEVFAPDMTAMASPVRERAKPTLGVISIAGSRMQQLAPALLQAAADLAATRGVSALFVRPPLGKA